MQCHCFWKNSNKTHVRKRWCPAYHKRWRKSSSWNSQCKQGQFWHDSIAKSWYPRWSRSKYCYARESLGFLHHWTNHRSHWRSWNINWNVISCLFRQILIIFVFSGVWLWKKIKKKILILRLQIFGFGVFFFFTKEFFVVISVFSGFGSWMEAC